MREKERLQFVESTILKWKECGPGNTSWKEALKSELGRKAKGRKFTVRRSTSGPLMRIFNRVTGR